MTTTNTNTTPEATATTMTDLSPDTSTDYEGGEQEMALSPSGLNATPAPTTTTTTDIPPNDNSNTNHSNANSNTTNDKDARLHWENVNLIATSASDNQKIVILDGVWGEAPQGEISAIMGPSGSGKTSLLNVLSGRMSNATHNVEVEATTVSWNGRPLDVSNLETRQNIAFVAQDDSLPVTATPREAIMFSARLRLDKHKTIEELQDITHRMLEQLHLESCADTFVGGTLLKGISGGERKRTSVGVELVCKPKLIFLDEPTSGLDSFNALELIQVLHEVANTGSAVMLTIHQPSSEIWDKFDRITLMKQGRVMYEGRRTHLAETFADCNYPLPPNYNPADWVMEVAQRHKINELQDAGFFPVNDFSQHADPAATTTTKPSTTNNGSSSNRMSSMLAMSAKADDRVGFMIQTEWLLYRELVNFKRNKHPLKTRTMMTLMISFLCGILFFQVGDEDFNEYINVQTLFGAMMLGLMANMFSTTLPALLAFPEERPVFLREYSTGQYSVTAYFVSRLAFELLVCAVQVSVSTMIVYLMVGLQQNFGIFWCATYIMAVTSTALGAMIGSSVADPTVAIEFLPAVFMPQILFAGFFIPFEIMPIWLSWLTYIFPLTYAVRLVLVQEFDGACDADTSAGFCNRLEQASGGGLDQSFCVATIGNLDIEIPSNCDVLLDNVDANSEDTWWYWIVLCAQFCFFRVLALIVLRRKAEQFY